MKQLHVKKGDTVIVISGNEKGKKGKVLAVDHENGRVIVEGVNMATKHKKPRRQGDTGGKRQCATEVMEQNAHTVRVYMLLKAKPLKRLQDSARMIFAQLF